MRSICLKQAFGHEGYCGCGSCLLEDRLGRKYPRAPARKPYRAGPRTPTHGEHCDCRECMAARALRRRARRNRPKVKRRVREAVYARDGHQCVKCGSPERLTIDHVIPLSAGGSNTQNNMQTLCETCNWSKGSQLEEASALPQQVRP